MYNEDMQNPSVGEGGPPSQAPLVSFWVGEDGTRVNQMTWRADLPGWDGAMWALSVLVADVVETLSAELDMPFDLLWGWHRLDVYELHLQREELRQAAES
jgi:hypothetical protein